jgi:hypothetical protein
MSRYWIAVACAEHTRRGRALGIMQVCHGKGAPLRRLTAEDGIVYYSPTASLGGKEKLQAFTAIGRVADNRAYQADMGAGFRPFRRAVRYAAAQEAAIKPLLDRLALTQGKRNWGAVFRFGLMEIDARDFATIAAAMQAEP